MPGSIIKILMAEEKNGKFSEQVPIILEMILS